MTHIGTQWVCDRKGALKVFWNGRLVAVYNKWDSVEEGTTVRSVAAA